MKRTLLSILTLLLAIAAGAQTLNVQVGSVTYLFPASQTGEMTYTDGNTLTILNKVFTLSDISSMTVDDTAVTDNLVSIAYNGSSATVTVAGNVAQYVTATISGAHVTIASTNTDAVDDDEITYQLSGTTTDGSLTLGGSYKSTISLAGVTLTNPSGAAITVTNSKRIQLSAKKGTENTLTDGSGSQKACIYSKGQLQLQGNGTLNVVGNLKHGIKSASYIQIKNLTLNITSAVGDGINCEEYFLMKSGAVNISGTQDDGIQCDLGGTASTGETTDHEDEDTGNMYFEGGTLTISTTAAASKGIKADGDVNISDGTINVTTSGSATWDSDDAEVKACACLSADGNAVISGGTLTLSSSGSGGKGISVDGTLTISDNANINATTTGAIAYCSSSSNTTIKTATSTNTTIENLNDALKTSPKAIKVDGAMTISGGNIVASAKCHEAIETKSTLKISGGYIYAESNDDAINSASSMTITGGYIYANSSGNDALDANGNMTISGGTIVGVAASGAEVGLDAAEGYTLSITGGNIIAIGGFENTNNLSGTAYQASSYTKGAWYGFYNASGTLITAFKVPSNSNMGTPMAVYTSTGTPSLKSGVTGSGTSYWNGNGYSSCSGGSTVSLSSYTNSGMGGGGNQGGGGNPGGGPGR